MKIVECTIEDFETAKASNYITNKEVLRMATKHGSVKLEGFTSMAKARSKADSLRNYIASRAIGDFEVVTGSDVAVYVRAL